MKVSTLSVSDYVEVRSRGGNYSLITITVDGIKLTGLHIVGTTKPNSGNDVLVVLRGTNLVSLVGWRDPVSGKNVVTIPGIMAAYPPIVLVAGPLFMVLFLAAPRYQSVWFSVLVALVLFLRLVPSIGWPGVKRTLRRHQTETPK